MGMKTVRFLICAVITVGGLLFSTQAGFYYLGFVDYYAVNLNLLVSVMIETLFFTWYLSWSQKVEVQIVEHVKIPTP
jgi:SNF family Na+-dependent transporter